MVKKKIQVISIESKYHAMVEVNTNTKIEHDRVVGIFAKVGLEEAIPGATIQAWIDGEEVLPQDTEVAVVSHSDSLSMEEAAFPVDEKAKNSTVRLRYTDNANINVPAGTTYNVKVYLLTEKDIKD